MKASIASRKARAIRVLWLMELLLILLAAVVAAALRFLNDPAGYALFFRTPMRMMVVAVFVTMAMASFGLYQVHVRHNRLDFLLRLLLSFAFGGIGLLVLYYLVPQAYIGRGVLAMSLTLGFVGVVALRSISYRALGGDAFKRRVLVYGAGNNADLINSSLRRSSDRQSFLVVGFVPVEDQPVRVADGLQVQTDMGLSELTQWLRIDEVVVAPDERRGGLPMDEMLDCAQRGIAICDLSTFFEREAGMVKLSVADPSWLAFSGGFDHSMRKSVV